MRIAVIGECMVELRQEKGRIVQAFGGDTLNTAVYLSRMSSGEEYQVSYITALGTDELSGNMLQDWQEEGIETSLVQTYDDKFPGLYMINVDELGERSFMYWRNDSAARYWLERMDEEKREALLGYDLFYLSGISLAILPPESRSKLMELLKEARGRGAKVVFDNNYRPRLWKSAEEAAAVFGAVLSQTDIALLTFDDEQLLYGDRSISECISRCQFLGIHEIVIKQGAGNCILVANGEKISVPAEKLAAEKVVDTTAAGDSFAAGYLAARLTGNEFAPSVMAGHKLAGLVIQHPGAVIKKELMGSLLP